MAKTTILFGVLLIALGLVGFFATGAAHPTALIPLWFGLALGVFGALAISPNPTRRKIVMHVNVVIGVVGCIGAFVVAIQRYGAARSAGLDPDMKSLAAQLVMAVILLVYTNLCIRSFIEARRARKV